MANTEVKFLDEWHFIVFTYFLKNNNRMRSLIGTCTKRAFRMQNFNMIQQITHRKYSKTPLMLFDRHRCRSSSRAGVGARVSQGAVCVNVLHMWCARASVIRSQRAWISKPCRSSRPIEIRGFFSPRKLHAEKPKTTASVLFGRKTHTQCPYR